MAKRLASPRSDTPNVFHGVDVVCSQFHCSAVVFFDHWINYSELFYNAQMAGSKWSMGNLAKIRTPRKKIQERIRRIHIYTHRKKCIACNETHHLSLLMLMLWIEIVSVLCYITYIDRSWSVLFVESTNDVDQFPLGMRALSLDFIFVCWMTVVPLLWAVLLHFLIPVGWSVTQLVDVYVMT